MSAPVVCLFTDLMDVWIYVCRLCLSIQYTLKYTSNTYASVETSVYCMHNLDWCVCVECMGPAGGPYGLLTGHCVVSCAPVVSV